MNAKIRDICPHGERVHLPHNTGSCAVAAKTHWRRRHGAWLRLHPAKWLAAHHPTMVRNHPWQLSKNSKTGSPPLQPLSHHSLRSWSCLPGQRWWVSKTDTTCSKIEHLFPHCMTGAKPRDRFGPVQVLSYFFKIACFFTRLPHLSSLSSLPNCVLIRCLCLSRSHHLSWTGDLRTPRKLNRNWQDCGCDHLQPRNPSHQLDFGRCWRQT